MPELRVGSCRRWVLKPQLPLLLPLKLPPLLPLLLLLPPLAGQDPSALISAQAFTCDCSLPVHPFLHHTLTPNPCPLWPAHLMSQG